MKGKLLIVALITVLMVVGMVLVSCSTCPGLLLTGSNKGQCGSSALPDCSDWCISNQILDGKSNPTCNC